MHRFAHIATFTLLLTAGLALGLAGLTLSGCGAATTTEQEDTGGYSAPAIREITFNEDNAECAHDCAIDTTNANAGYITASATSSGTLKFQVLCGDGSYNYDMPNDGQVSAFPMNMGDGTYTLRVMQNVEGNNYIQLFSTTVDVTLDSEFEPFLSPSIYCDFDKDSACVQEAQTLIEGANSQAAAAEAIYNWIVENIDYDTDKAKQVQNVTGYIPDPDETYTDKSGICFDFAALYAAMMRSVGIPTKIVTGYVAEGSIYHAWNMVYLEGTWVNVSFTVPANEWSRIDTAFASAGPQILGGKDDYVDRFVY